jgi:hypothetical protein
MAVSEYDYEENDDSGYRTWNGDLHRSLLKVRPNIATSGVTKLG